MEQRKLIIISFTEAGSRKNSQICSELPAVGYPCEGYTVMRFAKQFQLHTLKKELKEWLAEEWGKVNFLFIGSTGIAIRSVAHLIRDKYTDSAVIAMDEKARYVIPLLSGHIGGAVEIAEDIAGIFGAQAVLTTASDVQKKFAVDVFAKKNQLFITERVRAKEIAAAILAEKPVGFYSKYPVSGSIPAGLQVCENLIELEQYEDRIIVTDEKTQSKNGMLQLMPVNIIVGVGCRRDTPKQKLAAALGELLIQHSLNRERVEVLVSIDLKHDEKGLLELAEEYRVPFRTYSAEELKTTETGEESIFVKGVTGVGNVCESAARFYCPLGRVIQPKTVKDGMTFSLVERAVNLHFSCYRKLCSLQHNPPGDRTAAERTMSLTQPTAGGESRRARFFHGDRDVMKRILMFAGTTEGRVLAEFLQDYSAEIYISTATEYGRSCIGEQGNATVLAGRMNASEIEEFIRGHQIELTIDATHPFAKEVTENIIKACAETKTKYLRCLREKDEDSSQNNEAAVVHVSTVEEAIDYLRQTQGNILVTTGSKDLWKYTVLEDCHERCFVRVLSTQAAVAEAVRLGFEGRHLIAMQGPFSKEMNMALLRQVGADYMLTKETGAAGGFEEKKMAAAETGTTLIVIGRPAEQGLSLDETCKYINDFIIGGE